jgi:hypothetical protein
MMALRGPRHRRTHRTTALAFYLLVSWVLAPAVHAQLEVTSAEPAVEQGHTEDCTKIHAETLCLACGCVQFPLKCSVNRIPDADRVLSLHVRGLCRLPRPSPPQHGGNAVRAPPTR